MQINLFSIISLSFFLLPILVQSQDPFYINYDTNDGLPSSETYFAYADSSGLIWIATDRGVCAYDGYQFRTYTTKEGLSHNTNFRIFEDRKNRLWFTGWDGSLSIYENGEFTAVRLNKDSIFGQDAGFAIKLLFDEEHNVFIAKDRNTACKRPGIFYRLDADDFSLSRQSIFDFETAVWSGAKGEEAYLEIGDQYLFYDKRWQFAVNALEVDSFSSSWLIGFDQAIAKRFNNNKEHPFFRNLAIHVNNFFLDKYQNLWLCTPDGLLLFEQGLLDLPPQHFFKGMEVTSILMDREGGYWMTCREKGVFWIPSFQLNSLLVPEPNSNFETQRILSIGKLSDFLLFGTLNNGLLGIDKEFKNLHQLKTWDKVVETRQIYTFENTYYSSEFAWIKEVNGEVKSSEGDKFNINRSFVKRLKNGWFFSTRTNPFGGYFIYDQDEKLIFSSNDLLEPQNKRPYTGRVNCVEEVGGVLWLGGLDGLYYIQSDKLLSSSLQKDTAKIMDTRIEDIIPLDAEKIWIATIGNGLVYKNGEHFFQLSEEDGLSSNLINRIHLENDSTIWLGTNKGLDKVCFHEEGEGIKVQSISNFSTHDGLVSNFINDLEVWKGHLWLATNKGINYIQPQKLIEKKTAPIIFLEEVLAGERSIKEEQDCELQHGENDLLFNFLAVSFIKPKNKAFYRYRLTQDEEKAPWYPTDNKSIRFLDLAPGKYLFEVTAQNKNGYWSEQSASYAFTIHAHFTAQLWFQILAALLLIFLIGLGLYFRVQSIKNKEEQKLELQGAKLNALQNQMNPHFIFNSLNSIQSFIFHKDVKKASHFLSKFSKLMRSSLEYSRLDYISIHDEVTYLKSYLELEKLRFEDRFMVKVEVDPEIPVHHYFIPPLLFQPILENAVKHAFKNITHRGQLDVQFLNVLGEELIKVVICDNGQGLKQDKKTTSEVLHKSMGLSIIKNRIKLLNQNSKGAKASFSFSNRYNSQQEVIGAKAEFTIPIQFEKND